MPTPYEMFSVEEARQLVLSKVSLNKTERVPLLEAMGRVSAENLCSDVDISPFDHAAMDGFAVKSEDLEAASEENPVSLKVIAEVPAGSFYDGPIASGECVRIMTGAPTPAEVDSVVKYEIVDYMGSDGRLGATVSFSAPSKPMANIRSKAEEIGAGEIAVKEGEIINAGGIGFLASCGIATVETYKRPKVGIISIGSELINIDETPGQGTIRDSNGYALCASAVQAGAIPVRYPTVADDMDALTEVVLKAISECDFVVTSGGASDGDYDFIKKVVENEGELMMSLVNMRPGKAQTFGIIKGTPILGLAGNPAAAYIGFEVLVRPCLRKMQGFNTLDRPIVKAKITAPRKKKDSRQIYLRATLERRDGELFVTADKNQSSGSFGVLQHSDCLAIMPAGKVPVNEGDELDVMLISIEEGTVI